MTKTDIASYADDNTSYTTANTIDEVIKSLEHDSMMLFKWFSDNHRKANISKCHLLLNKKDEVTIKIGDMEIKNEHLNGIISKASRKTNALSRVMPYMSLSNKRNQ